MNDKEKIEDVIINTTPTYDDIYLSAGFIAQHSDDKIRELLRSRYVGMHNPKTASFRQSK